LRHDNEPNPASIIAMIKNAFTLEDLLKGTGGDLKQKGQEEYSAISTNSKEAQDGAIFWPLIGDKFDAHDFISQAIKNGAKAVVSAKDIELPKDVTFLRVADTLSALQDFARFWRRKMQKPVFAITGSNGKTTTKEFLQQILSSQYKVCYSSGSFNNHWGVPFSLLQIRPEHDLMISEMGMNHVGEIAKLCKIAEPDFTLVTVVGRAHLEYMKTVENIAKEKEGIYRASPQSSKIFNLDNSYTKEMMLRYQDSSQITFSLKDSSADVFLEKKEGSLLQGHIGKTPGEANFSVFGSQNLMNLAAAIAMAHAYGMPAKQIWSAISSCKTIWGRNQWVDLASGAKAVFDAYNANPDSMSALLDNIQDWNGHQKQFLVLGDMLEIGESNDQEHIDLARRVREMNFEKVYFIGKNAQLFADAYGKKNIMISDLYKESLAKDLATMLGNSDIVFMKASRSIGLENFLLALEPLNFESK